MSAADRGAMLDGVDKSPSVRRQCALLGVARSGIYRVWRMRPRAPAPERLHQNCELEYLPSLLPDLVVQNAQPHGCDEPERKVVNSRRICRTLWLPQPNGNGYDAEAFW